MGSWGQRVRYMSYPFVYSYTISDFNSDVNESSPIKGFKLSEIRDITDFPLVIENTKKQVGIHIIFKIPWS